METSPSPPSPLNPPTRCYHPLHPLAFKAPNSVSAPRRYPSVNVRTAAGMGGIRRGKTAAELAREHGHAEVVRLLEEASVKGGKSSRSGYHSSGGGAGGGRFGVSSGTLVITTVLALVLLAAGLLAAGGWYGMQTELREWRELRARKASRQATKVGAGAGFEWASDLRG